MSAANAPTANAPAANTKAANAPAANTKPAAGLLNGLFGAKKTEASANVNKSVLNQKNRNAANLVVKNQQHNNAKKAASGPGLMSSLFGAAKPANAAAPATAAVVNASLNKPAGSTRSRTRKQRGGALRVPGPRNVLRVTGKTVRKLRNVGVYGLKKVGNGVHMVTGLIGGVLKKGGNVVRKITRRNRKQ
jgi:hypothetical protein